MGVLSWIILGPIAGTLAKWIMPGRDPGGIVVTILLGIGGAIVGLFSLLPASDAYAESPERVRLFILSGQSNMVHVKPEESFTPIVRDAFPREEIVVVHYAKSGQLVRMWCNDWQPPTDAKPAGRGRNGRHYDQLMTEVAERLEGRPQPASVTFVWMQGEADAKHSGYGRVYGQALAGLLDQLRRDLGRNDVYFVVGRISDYGSKRPDERPEWKTVRDEQVKFAEADAGRAWVDTDDLNGEADGLHYTREGYRELGKRFATAAVRLIKTGEGATAQDWRTPGGTWFAPLLPGRRAEHRPGRRLL